MSAMTLKMTALAGGAILVLGLSACGTQGDLVRPAPLYGAAAKRQYDRDVAAGRTAGDPSVDAAASKRTASNTDSSGSSRSSDDNAPRTTRDIQDPAQKLTPLSASPIDGLPNPLGAPVSTRPPG
jgi:hypothetical protein